MISPQQAAVVIDERKLLDLALDHQPLGVLRLERALVHDEPIDRRHAVRHARRPRRFTKRTSRSVSRPASRRWSSTTTSVPTRDRAIRAAASASDAGRRDAVGIGDHAVLRALDDLDLADLRLDLARPEAAIDDADAAFFGLHDRHRRPRDRVHVGRDDRPLERDAARQPARQVDGRGSRRVEHAVLRRQDEVVERAAAHQIEHRGGPTAASIGGNADMEFILGTIVVG